MFRPNTIFNRVLLLLSVSTVVFLLLFIFLYFYTFRQEKDVYNSAREQFSNEVESLLELNSESMHVAVDDFTRSEELLKFTQTRSTKWYNQNIIGAVKSLKVDYICIYDSAYNIITETSSIKILSRRFIPSKAVPVLRQAGHANFFLITTEGLVEVSAASIHPSYDQNHTKTIPNGYAFMVRLWDQSFKNKLRNITSSTIDFSQPHGEEEKPDRNTVTVSKNLNDWNGKTVSKIVFSRPFHLNFKSARYLLLIVVFSFILFLLIFISYARLWVYKPLNLITQILESENSNAIAQLKKSPGEFSYIGMLFSDYFIQRKNLENAKKKAEESDKLKSAFLSNMAHEIRTPMHGILGFADILKNTSISAEQLDEYISIIEKSSTRMLNTITDLIEISKIESGQIAVVLSNVNINTLLENIYTGLKPETEKKGLRFQLRLPDDTKTLLVNTDREKLETILIKLHKNAIKYTPKGSIESGYVFNGRYIRFFVKDTGIGIEAEKQSKIFDHFTQADNSLSKVYDGAGLGLSITKAYVEMLGGTIWVESQLGVGSTFNFTIPHQDLG